MNNSSVTANATAMATKWPTSDELDTAVDGFFESTFGIQWDSWDACDLVDHIAWFGSTTGRGDIFDWDADRAVDFLVYAPEGVHLAEPARIAALPALLRSWIRYAGSEDGTSALEVRRSLAAIEHAEPLFFGSITEALVGASGLEC